MIGHKYSSNSLGVLIYIYIYKVGPPPCNSDIIGLEEDPKMITIILYMLSSGFTYYTKILYIYIDRYIQRVTLL